MRSLFVSANIDDEVRRQAEPFMPLGFIGKPFLAAEVIAAVRAAAMRVYWLGLPCAFRYLISNCAMMASADSARCGSQPVPAASSI